MQFITTDQRIAVEAFSVGDIYQVIYTDNSYFLGACVGIGDNFVMFQRPEPELLFALTMQSAADVAAINDDIVISRTYSGTPPLSFLSNGQPLLSWQIYGNPEGVGDKTANLFDYQTMSDGGNGYLRDDGTFTSSTDWQITKYIPCDGNSFVINPIGGNAPAICLYDSDKNYITGKSYNTGGASAKRAVVISTETTAKFIRFTYKIGTGADNLSELMLNSGSTELPYEPHGYKIPISCGGETNTIYLDTPLYDGNSISMAETGVEIPTTNGQNILAVDTTVQPISIIMARQ